LKFDNIVERYDFLNHLFSFLQDYYWRRVMVRELKPLNGSLVLDLATGTGDSAIGLVKEGVTVAGLDLSLNMLLKAKKKIPQSNFFALVGSAYHIQFKDNTFDGMTCAFGIRNMHETKAALKEIFRVLKKGGKAVFLEFSMPANIMRRPYRFYLKRIIPMVSSFFSIREAYEYLGDSIEKFYSPEEFARCITESGFNNCEMRPLSMGCVYIHKAYKK